MSTSPEPWKFEDIFIDDESRQNFIADILAAFEHFPPELQLTCDDFYSIFSLVCLDIPYNFIVFVCECVDPSISTGSLPTRRIAFGNFLLGLPCCILYPSYVHRILLHFKNADTIRKGVIKKSIFIQILRSTYAEIGGKELENLLQNSAQVQTTEESQLNEVAMETVLDYTQVPLNFIKDDSQYELPELQIITDVENAARDLEQASIQTFFFVLWQKNSILLNCKSMIHDTQNYSEEEQNRSETNSGEQVLHNENHSNPEKDPSTSNDKTDPNNLKSCIPNDENASSSSLISNPKLKKISHDQQGSNDISDQLHLPINLKHSSESLVSEIYQDTQADDEDGQEEEPYQPRHSMV